MSSSAVEWGYDRVLVYLFTHGGLNLGRLIPKLYFGILDTSKMHTHSQTQFGSEKNLKEFKIDE